MGNNDIRRIRSGDKDIILIGTAHVSRESADLVENIIEDEKPDTVCVELCQSRYDAITQKDAWEKTDLVGLVRKKRTSLLLFQLLMASVQKKLADRFGIKPGEEMLRAIQKADSIGASLVLADRDIRTTLIRTWRNIGFTSKLRLLFEVPISLFLSDDITEEEIEALKEKDSIEIALENFGKKLPEIKTTLIDERDRYLASSITGAEGKKIVAVVGAGHVPGILSNIGKDIDLETISAIPPKRSWGKIVAWGISFAVIGLIIYGFFHSGAETSINMIKWWIAVNGILAGLGALAVFAHPVTVLASVAAAPFTSLNPMIAAGWIAGLTEATLRKPQVKDFIALRSDIGSVRGFWQNKITRILLIVVLVNLGSTIGTFIAIPLMMKLL
ncbi:MAG: TraB/GumN family protein [Syntrophales bacterium]|jgi:pheromone shutdown-related protein TraB|nr:TraB/GumN family protein [Syntrophales bacterium]MDY0044212.1 TraB/GumN family protein [Syntrophales bacterium]